MAKFQELFQYANGDLEAVSGGIWVKQSGSTNWTYLIESNRLKITHLTAGDSNILWAYAAAGASAGDLDVIAKMVVTDITKLAGGSPIGPAIIDTTQNASYALRYPAAGQWRLAYWVGIPASAHIGAQVEGTVIESGVPFWARVKRVGDTIYGMVWRDGDPMPGTFPMSGAHTTIKDARVGFSFSNYPPQPYFIDYMTFGTGGDSASLPVAGPQISSITGARSGVLRVGEKNIVAAVAGAGAVQGSGKLRICPSDSINDVNGYDQTITSWSDTAVVFDLVRGNLPLNTQLFAFLRNDSGESNAAGFKVRITPPAAVLAFHLLS